MEQSKIYPNIDMKKTGQYLKLLVVNAGYSVKDIQVYLRLSCPQPIYRWFKGLILPSVNHLLMLSQLLGVHMENLLIKEQGDYMLDRINKMQSNKTNNRLFIYYKKIMNMVS